jgi:hypothetical protein
VPVGAFAGLLAVVCLAVAALHVVRFAVLRTDPACELSHGAMGAGMAAMFSPFGDPVPAPVWTGVFVLCGAWFAAVAPRADRAHARHHVIGSGAMLFMLLGSHGGGVAGAGSVHAGHVDHDPGVGAGLASLVAIVLAGYFAWHVLRCVDRLREHPAPAAGTVRARTSVLRDARVLAVAHVVMAVATTVMLLGMV